jgi:AcrR family transcriptional regulator
VKGGTERRAAVFTALRGLLLEHPWGEVTLEAVAKEAGVSRQTLYNTFGSRYGLAQAYTLDLAEALCDLIEETVAAHPGDPRTGLEAAFRLYLDAAATDPLMGGSARARRTMTWCGW